MDRLDNLQIENAKIIFRNFSGAPSQYNREGDRNFSVIIDDAETAKKLSEDGWNVKIREPKEDGDSPLYHLKVAVSYKNIPPKIYLISGRQKTLMTEDTIHELDVADIVSVDLIIRPYYWQVQEKEGVKAYVKTMYVTLERDEFASKYDYDEEEVF